MMDIMFIVSLIVIPILIVIFFEFKKYPYEGKSVTELPIEKAREKIKAIEKRANQASLALVLWFFWMLFLISKIT